MLVLVASTRPAKVEGVREAIAAIARLEDRFIAAEIRPVDVGDVAPRMPMTRAAVIEGARRRAAALLAGERSPERGSGSLKTSPDPRSPVPQWFAVGAEGGVDPLPIASDGAEGPRYGLQTWACVTDGTHWSYGAGGTLLLPDAVTQRVLAGEELGDLVDGLASKAIRGTRGAWGLLTRDLVTRQDAFRTAVMAAFAPFFNSEQYPSHR